MPSATHCFSKLSCLSHTCNPLCLLGSGPDKLCFNRDVPFVLVPKNTSKCHLHSYFQILFIFPRKCFHIILPSTNQIKTPELLLLLRTLADSRGRGRLLHFIANNLNGRWFHFLTLEEEQSWSFSCSSAQPWQTSPRNVLLTSHALDWPWAGAAMEKLHCLHTRLQISSNPIRRSWILGFPALLGQ